MLAAFYSVAGGFFQEIRSIFPTMTLTSPEKTIALLVAAGKSERMQMDQAKPYLTLSRDTVLRRAVKTFLEHPLIDGVRVVIRREHHAA